MNNELVSIIIPVYNAETYLRRCLESVVNQTHKNLEIILIDDCSTDGSSDICKEYAKRDKRIIFLENNSNLGQAGTRNRGVEKASGDFITFVDNDDTIDPKMYETLLADARRSKVGVVGCATLLVFEDGSTINNYLNKMSGIKKSDELVRKILMHSDDAWGTVWNKLFSKELKQLLAFPIGKELEDYYVLINLYLTVNEVYFDHTAMYRWYQRSGSQSKRGYHEKIDTLVDVSVEIRDRLKGKGYEKELAFFEYVNRYQVIMAKYKSKNKDLYGELRDEIAEIEKLNKIVAHVKSRNRNIRKMIIKIKMLKFILLFCKA